MRHSTILERHIEALLHLLSFRDIETEVHARRVTAMVIEFARMRNVGDDQLVHITRGALLHDIGKIGVPDAILHKTTPLTETERAVIRMHPLYAYDLLEPIPYLRPALDIPYCHHEKWDGTGYPRGLRGAEIPFAARIFAVVDVWDALLSDRPYRPAWSRERALCYIHEQVGKHFEPEAVRGFEELQGRLAPLALLPNVALAFLQSR